MRGDIEKEVVGQMKFGLDEFFAGTGYTYRVMAEDDESYCGTCDCNPKRVNLTIEKGMVVNATIG